MFQAALNQLTSPKSMIGESTILHHKEDSTNADTTRPSSLSILQEQPTKAPIIANNQQQQQQQFISRGPPSPPAFLLNGESTNDDIKISIAPDFKDAKISVGSSRPISGEQGQLTVAHTAVVGHDYHIGSGNTNDANNNGNEDENKSRENSKSYTAGAGTGLGAGDGGNGNSDRDLAMNEFSTLEQFESFFQIVGPFMDSRLWLSLTTLILQIFWRLIQNDKSHNTAASTAYYVYTINATIWIVILYTPIPIIRALMSRCGYYQKYGCNSTASSYDNGCRHSECVQNFCKSIRNKCDCDCGCRMCGQECNLCSFCCLGSASHCYSNPNSSSGGAGFSPALRSATPLFRPLNNDIGPTGPIGPTSQKLTSANDNDYNDNSQDFNTSLRRRCGRSCTSINKFKLVLYVWLISIFVVVSILFTQMSNPDLCLKFSVSVTESHIPIPLPLDLITANGCISVDKWPIYATFYLSPMLCAFYAFKNFLERIYKHSDVWYM